MNKQRTIMNNCFSWGHWQYYLTPSGIPKKRIFIISKGWQKSIRITHDEYTNVAKKYHEVYLSAYYKETL